MRQNIKILSLILFLLISIGVNAEDKSTDNNKMSGVTNALENVVKECIQYSMVSTGKLTNDLSYFKNESIPDSDKNEFALSSYNRALKTCLQIGAFKLTQAAEGIKIDEK